jgi:hypothetical protein
MILLNKFGMVWACLRRHSVNRIDLPASARPGWRELGGGGPERDRSAPPSTAGRLGGLIHLCNARIWPSKTGAKAQCANYMPVNDKILRQKSILSDNCGSGATTLAERWFIMQSGNQCSLSTDS